ncbi:MAG: DUF3754 domain-containing protein [Thermoguttaceae bacterium]|nr:DUF3754 domain-containing protein [Thermoguttaceae bacterium]
MSSDLAFLNRREMYIPIRISVLLDRILADDKLSAEEKDQFRIFAEMIGHRFHFDFYDELGILHDSFVPFDPDRDTYCDVMPEGEERLRQGTHVVDGLMKLASDCNFVSLSEDELNQCLSLQPNGGVSVRVDLTEFESFRVFFRGMELKESKFPWWCFWRRNQVIQTRILKRTLVLARYRAEAGDKGGNIIVKLFKDVPVENIKIIAPKVIFNMPFFERLKVGGSFLGGLGVTFVKVMKIAMFTGQILLFLAASLIIVIVKGIMSFFNSRTKYLLKYSSSLYFQSFSNNTSAISSLVHMAEEQEIKETILAVYMLYIHRKDVLTEDELDKKVEQWLFEQFGKDVDFEVDDALRKLEEKRLMWKQDDGDGVRYNVYPLHDLLARLDEDWDNFYQYNTAPSPKAE